MTSSTARPPTNSELMRLLQQLLDRLEKVEKRQIDLARDLSRRVS